MNGFVLLKDKTLVVRIRTFRKGRYEIRRPYMNRDWLILTELVLIITNYR